MAPMAGVTDKPFRILVREMGCDLVFTEMISGKAIQYNNRRTWNMLDLKGESPIGVQLFGSDPQVMANAAKVAEAEGASLIDINMGCPVPKVVNNGEGAALMKIPDTAFSIVRQVSEAVSIPVTVKIRSGWDNASVNAVAFAQGLAKSGAAAITVHGRTRAQMYSGTADWDIIAKVVRAVEIPVIGNGDIWAGKDAKKIINQTGCQGIMMARGVLGNPWLFREVKAALAGKDYSSPSYGDKIAMAVRHLRMEVAYRGEKMAVPFMRKHLAWYLKGMPETAALKRLIFSEASSKVIERLLRDYIQEE